MSSGVPSNQRRFCNWDPFPSVVAAATVEGTAGARELGIYGQGNRLDALKSVAVEHGTAVMSDNL